MGALERVMQLKREGIAENEIINKLTNEGISPRDISDALAQAKIKERVMQDEEEFALQEPQKEEKMAENTNTYQEENADFYTQQPMEERGQEYQENLYAAAYAKPTAGAGYEANTIIEIAEQVFHEKSSSMQRKIDELNELKSIVNIKLENISERLKRIESLFDKLQISVMEEVSSYGKGVSNLKKEVEMVEDSFSKIANKLPERSGRTSTSKKRTHK